MADVFLSYSRNDKARAELLANRLVREGWSVFWDPAIEPGHQWDEVILSELLSARVVIVGWSAAAVRSRWVREEASIGARRGVLVPVILDASLADQALPFGFNLIQAEHLAEWDGIRDTPAIENVLRAVAAKLQHSEGTPGQAPRQAGAAKRQSRQPALKLTKAMLGSETDAAAAKAAEVMPLSKFELIERLGSSWHMTAEEAENARRFFRALAAWRGLTHADRLAELDALYFPFDPETYHFRSAADGDALDARQEKLMDQMRRLLAFAGYERIDQAQLAGFLTSEQSSFGLDVSVDLSPYEIIDLYYRGPYTRSTRTLSTRFLGLVPWWKDSEIGLFQRTVAIFKLKSVEAHVRDIAETRSVSPRRARAIAERARASMPPSLVPECIYLRQFRNFHRFDLSMLIPNSRIQFRFTDKLKLGLTAGTGLGMAALSGVVIAINPIMAMGAIVGLVATAFRQAMNFMSSRQRYLAVLAQNLYLLSVADNRNVIALLSDQAEDERIVAELLSYYLLSREAVPKEKLARIKDAVAQYLLLEYGTSLRVDIGEALSRLSDDGFLVETADGKIQALPPPQATRRIEELWSRRFAAAPALAAQ